MSDIAPNALLTEEIVLKAVENKPNSTVAELRVAIPIKGITKKDLNKILYRLNGTKVTRKETDAAPIWVVNS